MENRFKFRAWDNHCKRFRDEFDWGIDPDTGKPHWIHDGENWQDAASQLELMQCTGLRDKARTLIYESDYITLKCGDLEIICLVVWIEDRAEFSLKHPEGHHGHYGFNKDTIEVCDKFEILGHIYQHPNLLK